MVGRTNYLDVGKSWLISPGRYGASSWGYHADHRKLSALYVAVYSPVDSIGHISFIVADANVLADKWTSSMSDTLIHTRVEGRDVDVFLYVYPAEKLRKMPSTIQVKFDGNFN